MLPDRDLDDLLGDMISRIEGLARRVSDLEKLEDAMAQNHGWIAGAWQKDPLRLGYSGDKTETVTQKATAGTNILVGTAVPAGEIWIVQSVSAFNGTSATTRVALYASINGNDVALAQAGAGVAALINTIWTGSIVLSEGDTVRAALAGCTLNDDIYLNYHAVRVDIDQ